MAEATEKTPITAYEWKQVKEELGQPWGVATLHCDGYELTLAVQQDTPLKFVIQVYVNGVVKGEWYGKDCEERRRFLRPVIQSLFTQAEKKRLAKACSKSQLARTMTTYRSAWGSFTSLKRHLVANNQVISFGGLGHA